MVRYAMRTRDVFFECRVCTFYHLDLFVDAAPAYIQIEINHMFCRSSPSPIKRLTVVLVFFGFCCGGEKQFYVIRKHVIRVGMIQFYDTIHLTEGRDKIVDAIRHDTPDTSYVSYVYDRIIQGSPPGSL